MRMALVCEQVDSDNHKLLSIVAIWTYSSTAKVEVCLSCKDKWDWLENINFQQFPCMI